MTDIEELVEEKIRILATYPFFTDFMDSEVPDNNLFLDSLKRGGLLRN